MGAIEYGGAVVLARVFHFAALAIAVLGTFGAVAGAVVSDDLSASERVGFAVSGSFGAIFAAAAVAFFGYVLDLLVAIYSQVWELRFQGEDDE